MSALPVIPDSAPFNAEQRAWLNGFFAGMFSRSPAAVSPELPSVTLVPLSILWGSQTGTTEGLAKRLAKEAGKRNFAPTILDMGGCDLARLASERNVLLLTSTYGDGEPPDNAKRLHDLLGQAASGADRPLGQVRFAVCAFGDTNYTQFCKCGADFDGFLEKLGATRVSPRTDCDLEYDEKFRAWMSAALDALANAAPATPLPVAAAPAAITLHSVGETGFSRSRPYPATVLMSRALTAVGSAKQVHHLEFDLGDSGLRYEAGDALGVYPHNCPGLVADILTALGCDGEEAVPAPDGTSTSLRRALTELYDVGKPPPELLAVLAPAAVGRGAEATVGLAPFQVIDALAARADLKPTPAEFVRLLRRLQPRLYSISSSPRAHVGQVHLTVGAVRYEVHGRARKGVCSTYLTDRVVPGVTRAGVFIHTNAAFRLPSSGDRPVIMIGPGTGIAPFRGFLHERRAAGARGKNWLFFGDQRATTDHLYRDELSAFSQDGTLTRLATAFSRDQAEKIYVQHRMLEEAAELYGWLEAGAHLYVCGDASRMAKDVDAALHLVVQRAGGRTAGQAAEYVDSLKASRRYARDVY